ncbi:acetoacetate--CoA ligase [Candidatus Pelagibacter sp.]|nr:acetoacetate--CoA ligase [Candidatus Pelagibacter sp.]
MKKKLWEASLKKKLNSNLYNFEKYISNKFNKKFNKKYEKILSWSINNPGDFWSSIWDFSKIKGTKSKIKIKKSKIFYKNSFLPTSKINFTENLLSKKDKTKAITFISENTFREERNWESLNHNISKLNIFFKKINIKKKDRVAAYMPNTIENVEAFMATAAIGAIWSSCSPDFGTNGVIERFSQIKPKLLFVTDQYFYNGKKINILNRVEKILKKIKSIKYLVLINYPGQKYINKNIKFKNTKVYYLNDINKIKIKNKKIEFEKFDFDHELAILYSSGTTGKPKCICHKSGGVLLQHKKEHQLHCDIKENDNIFYFTTCGWMMWNWLVSTLASKASIVLFDGFPMYKKDDLLLKIAKKEKITLFGISAKYIDALHKSKISIKYKLPYLRTICSTGSPLSRQGFEYIYKNIKKDVHLSSISGGTDIISCFVLGNLYQPVISGEIQNKGLGLDVDIYNDRGKSLKNLKGELVCKNPFPSMPLKFWNDKNDTKFKNAYFNKFSNVWYHGDYAEVSKNGGFVIHGRSDTTLNPGGVRLGTAEIYSEVESFKEIKESIVVGQAWDNDIRIVLFIVLNSKYKLDDNLYKKIKLQIRMNASPRHVPSKILVVKDIPKTKNGKLVELAVKNTIEGTKIKNKEALANPEILEQYKNLKELSY